VRDENALKGNAFEDSDFFSTHGATLQVLWKISGRFPHIFVCGSMSLVRDWKNSKQDCTRSSIWD
jgi:hypothetical protein